MVAIIDYGAGNLKSLFNACQLLGYSPRLVSSPDALGKAARIILPGVGNFGPAMKELEPFREVLMGKIDDGVPFLGICLGIHLVLEASDESPGTEGLGIFGGSCRRFPSTVKIPHMGWNNVSLVRDSPLTEGIIDDSLFYFVHSFYALPERDDVVLGGTEYGLGFPSIIGEGDVYATQFHPEKSGEMGLKLLRNFLEL
ncbi:MAG: imidazole glycerol phosphate synthase subunit HisH [Candidatus Altiarchaeota archaeon]|nr:imidazole glycerol phosphate synthase subunit HisH [Candidatus Altiarchaeota archaeon]